MNMMTNSGKMRCLTFEMARASTGLPADAVGALVESFTGGTPADYFYGDSKRLGIEPQVAPGRHWLAIDVWLTDIIRVILSMVQYPLIILKGFC
jgi:hypothetical protein